jgi:hypothetical protein
MFKEAGLGLDTIRSLSASAERATRHEILRAQAEKLRSTIAAARASLELIEGGLNCEYEDITQCPNYQRLIAEQVGSQVPEHGRTRDGKPPASRDDRTRPGPGGASRAAAT